MKLSKQQIASIAEELDIGMTVYINRATLEIKTVLAWDDLIESEFWDDEIEKIEEEWTDYIILEKMESRTAFLVMEEFCDEVQDERLREDLIKILSRRSPFANFKIEVESSDYRQKWFDFKAKKYEEYVMSELEFEDIEFEK